MNSPLETVFIIAAAVPGNKATEPIAVYYRGIVQPNEMTFSPNGTRRFTTRAQAETFRKESKDPHRFRVIEHILYRQIVK